MTRTVPSATAARASQDLATAVGRLHRRIREASPSEDLTPSQTSVIGQLGKPGPHSASTLAAAERVRPQSMAATIAVLEDRGFVARHADPADGRRQLVTLTTDGEAFLRGGRAARRAWLAERIQATLSHHEIQQLIAASALIERVVSE